MANLTVFSVLILILAAGSEGRWGPLPLAKGPPPPPPKGPPILPQPTEGPVPTEGPSAPTEGPDDGGDGVRSKREQVMDMIQEGIDSNGAIEDIYNTCLSSSYSQSFASNCEDDAVGFYDEFDWDDDWRVIIVSGAPTHASEEDSTPFCTANVDLCKAINPDIDGGRVNPNRRCNKWQYIVLPKNPQTTGTFSDTPLGSTGFATSGAVIYNHLANPDGSVAWYDEIQSLDVGMGHSDPDGNYHYHGVPYLIEGADDKSTCTKVGYLFDGFPVHGMCEDADGNEMISCWKLTEGAIGENFDDYYYDTDAYDAGTCHLDKANGRMFEDGYGYVTTTNFPGIPLFYAGTSLQDSAVAFPCGFCPEDEGFC